jgi:hypothetical protein
LCRQVCDRRDRNRLSRRALSVIRLPADHRSLYSGCALDLSQQLSVPQPLAPWGPHHGVTRAASRIVSTVGHHPMLASRAILEPLGEEISAPVLTSFGRSLVCVYGTIAGERMRGRPTFPVRTCCCKPENKADAHVFGEPRVGSEVSTSSFGATRGLASMIHPRLGRRTIILADDTLGHGANVAI